jgi:transaldolase
MPRRSTMRATRLLAEAGQSIWLDNITRELLGSGTLARYVDELSVSGLTSNPTIFERAVTRTTDYDDEIAALAATGLKGDGLLFEMVLNDLTRAADILLPAHRRTAGVDGWVSVEVAPGLAYDSAGTVVQAEWLFEKASRPNFLVKIPGTKEGLVAIEEAIFRGVPVNVTLLFAEDQYVAAAEAYMRGIERRVASGLDPDIRSVASVFVSRWDKATAAHVSEDLRNKLGIAVGTLCYKAYRDLKDSDRWQRLENLGARPQRLLFASTGTKDPGASDVLYVEGLVAPNTIDTMPEDTLLAFADHGQVAGLLARDGGNAVEVVSAYSEAGIGMAELAAVLQVDGAKAFSESWRNLSEAVAAKTGAL